MLFNSIDFLIFFPIVLLVYYVLPSRIRYIWLLFASYYFYMGWNAKYALLILFSTIVTYLSGLLLEKFKCKKTIILASFVLNLGMLFYFKYINFAFDVLAKLFAHMHIELSVPTFDIILPVGISFYTLQALSYTMDVYRGQVKAEKNFFRYALFVSFFPQLVAGPIERSKTLLKQLANPRKFCYEDAREGLLLMLWGYFLKIVIADRAAILVDTVYNDIETFGGMYLIVATVIFAFQVYCDFYGYSVIAMGTARFLGIQLMENFNAPFYSTSIAEFWRKWHISLTSWFKDYLYFPLGGSRKGKIRKYINQMIIFIVSGLWHGANLTYVAWGGINGIYQIIGEILQPIRKRIIQLFHLNENSFGHKFIHMLVTDILFVISLFFFRASHIRQAFDILKSIRTNYNPWILFDGSIYECGLNQKNFWLLMLCICILMFADYCKHKGIRIREVIARQDAWFRCCFIALSISFILVFGLWGPTFDQANFIYFQF